MIDGQIDWLECGFSSLEYELSYRYRAVCQRFGAKKVLDHYSKQKNMTDLVDVPSLQSNIPSRIMKFKTVHFRPNDWLVYIEAL